ncbi:MAG: TlpA disulfide reductase family protein [Oligoflexia bacterium]|nr:TlpA disulfide reductase family protein [Oligoflexia bacterium]
MLKGTLTVFAILLLSFSALATEVGDQAPCLNVDQIKVDGSRANHSLCDRNEGTQYLLLDFFQTTCGSCIDNLPNLTKLSIEAQTTTTTRLIAIDRNEQAVVDFVRKYQDLIKFEVPLDSKRAVAQAYNTYSTPTTYVVDKTNKVIYKHIGGWSDANYAELSKILAQ